MGQQDFIFGSPQAEEGEEVGPEMKMRRRESGEGHLDQVPSLIFWNPRWESSLLMVRWNVHPSFLKAVGFSLMSTSIKTCFSVCKYIFLTGI